MEIKSISITDGGAGGNGQSYFIRLSLPQLECERGRGDALNGFYLRMAESLKDGAKRLGISVLCEHTVTYASPFGFSLYADILLYRERRLLDCFRICDTRDADGLTVTLPSRLKKEIPDSFLWYYNGEKAIVCRNIFPVGSDERIRRSCYRKFIEEKEFDLTPKELFGLSGKGASDAPAEADAVRDV